MSKLAALAFPSWLTDFLVQMGIFYLMSKRVLRSIPYGQKPRNRLDMYIPRHHWKNPDVCIPVIIYVTGESSLCLLDSTDSNWVVKLFRNRDISKYHVVGDTVPVCKSRRHWNAQISNFMMIGVYSAGGAWTIGYKAWGSLLGRRLSKNGVIVCCLDYRNFPQVGLSDKTGQV